MSERRWQFSVRGLLVLTAIVSFVLAFAVTLPIAFRWMLIVAAPVLILAAILTSANFATSESRPRLALISWSVLGAFFGLYAFAVACAVIQSGDGEVAGPLLGFSILVVCFVACVVRGFRCCRLIGAAKSDAGSQLDDGSLSYRITAETQRQ